MRCNRCTHYQGLFKDYYWGDYGECRFNPPIYSKTFLDKFPKVRETSWCSKFKEKA